ncbi:hypothetical protein VFMJ11_0180 [Aliivibrio fischeri MJ11]|uniref:Surface carbohydrate biosynthesis protein n=1 Tax=Aliivibrio fischeri (strain MJ11) TaxID=388396 RepID=B5FFW4_ALIFM|nr:surface carbohydrate biosynthesis protein [Aliivibrio fischeri]ACH65049.1 hypothetical protein VFMJ11_0180 [Aliivibrio fischeri MJ11]
MKKTVFIPVETYVREYHYKFALGAMLTEKGYRVVIGQAEYLDKIKHLFHPGVYIGKNIFKTLFPTSINLYKEYKKLGWSILHLDEEGGIYAGKKNEWQQELDGRLDPNVLENDDTICCWGDFQKEHYTKQLKKGHEVKIIATGQPKFQYQNPLYIALLGGNINSEKPYILFNMNYSVYNNQLGREFFLLSKDKYRSSKIENESYKRAIWLDQQHNFGSILGIIKKMLSDPKFEDYQIVVRPHPAEKSDIYDVFFSNTDRVIVSNKHTAIEWSMYSNCVIHDGCTTGVEAYLSNIKVVNYRDQPAIDNENLVPNSVGYFADNYNDLKEIILNDNNLSLIRNEKLCHSMIKNFDQNIDSFTMLLEEVDVLMKNKTSGRVSFLLSAIAGKKLIRDYILYYPRRFSPSRRSHYEKEKNKLDRFDLKDIENKVNIINDYFKSNVRVSFYNKKCFVIE